MTNVPHSHSRGSSEGLLSYDDNNPSSFDFSKAKSKSKSNSRSRHSSSSTSRSTTITGTPTMKESSLFTRLKEDSTTKKLEQMIEHNHQQHPQPQLHSQSQSQHLQSQSHTEGEEALESFTILTDDVEDDLHYFSMGTSTDDFTSSYSGSDDDENENENEKSSMTFGSAHHLMDSFTAISNTGLSSVDSSLDDSTYNFRENFVNRKEAQREQERQRQQQAEKNHNQGDNNPISSVGGDHGGQQHGNGIGMGKEQPYASSRNRNKTSHLPRLTVQTHPHTAALLKGGDVNGDGDFNRSIYVDTQQANEPSRNAHSAAHGNDNEDHAPLKTPLSQGTAGTDPITPMSAIIDDEEEDEEFPSLQNSAELNKTVQFTVSSRSNHRNNSRSPMSNGIPRIVNPNKNQSPDESNLLTSKSISMSASMSTSLSKYTEEDISNLPSFDTSYIRQKRMTKEHRARARALAERDFYNNCLKQKVIEYGPHNAEVARAMANLGSSLMRCKAFSDALEVYKRAVAMLRVHFGDDSLMVAKALNNIGYAASMNPTAENLDYALIALQEALSIRIAYHGPHHCDCVETLNNIAGVYLHKREWAMARDLYLDVLTTRAAIFGRSHGSIPVTAQTLAKVFSRLSDFPNALRHLELALEIYKGDSMKLRDNHPLVVKVKKSIISTENLMASLG